MKTWEELTELEQLACQYSDFHKEAHGSRPRHSLEGWAVERFEKEFEILGKICEENQKEEAEREAEAIKEVEAMISRFLPMAGSREAAIRWISESEDAVDDPQYLCYKLGVPYGYFSNQPSC